MKKAMRSWRERNGEDEDAYEWSESVDKEIYTTIDLEEILGHSLEAAKDLDAMLTGVMTHLHSTGADTFEILRDNNLADWWKKKLAEIKKHEALEAAREKAKNSLTKEQRKLLGLGF